MSLVVTNVGAKVGGGGVKANKAVVARIKLLKSNNQSGTNIGKTLNHYNKN